MRILSIIVVAFNERTHIGRLKASFDALTLDGDVEVETLLIDGGSTDGTVEYAHALGFTRVEVLPGANIPVCRNAGNRAASGDWIAHVDADCELSTGWLQAARPFLEGETPTVMGWPVAPPEPGTWVERAWHTHWTHKNLVLEDEGGRAVVRNEAFRLITTRNLVMNRAIVDAIGGFDEALPTGEDTDFVFRAYQRGLRVMAVPELQVIHYGEPKTLREFYKQQLWHANRSSYTKIIRESRAQTGGNAPKFTVLYLVTAGLFFASCAATLITQNPWWLIAALPWPGLIALPAAMISMRARKPGRFVQLCILYAAYGLARSLDMLGFYRRKQSWKSVQ
ncbi:MAG: glycosyltransferase involved in cell wall biosynthesis [Kiritimatiellia bacterium]|jgi:glycosyltransferase involved in cell wall biosynthesis